MISTAATASATRPDPDQLWGADVIYVRTFAGRVCAAFVLDVYSRRVVGWQSSTSEQTVALDRARETRVAS